MSDNLNGFQQMLPAIPWGVQLSHGDPQRMTLSHYIRRHAQLHRTITLLCAKAEELKHKFSLLALEAKVWKQQPQTIGGFHILNLPVVPPLMFRVLRLILVTRSTKYFLQQTRNSWVGFGKSDFGVVIRWAMSIAGAFAAATAGNRYEPIGIYRSSQISVDQFFFHRPIVPRGKIVGKKSAGRTLIVFPRFERSTGVCPECGFIGPKLPLDVRSWTCECGALHDRDIAAAKVIAMYTTRNVGINGFGLANKPEDSGNAKVRAGVMKQTRSEQSGTDAGSTAYTAVRLRA